MTPQTKEILEALRSIKTATTASNIADRFAERTGKQANARMMATALRNPVKNGQVTCTYRKGLDIALYRFVRMAETPRAPRKQSETTVPYDMSPENLERLFLASNFRQFAAGTDQNQGFAYIDFAESLCRGLNYEMPIGLMSSSEWTERMKRQREIEKAADKAWIKLRKGGGKFMITFGYFQFAKEFMKADEKNQRRRKIGPFAEA